MAATIIATAVTEKLTSMLADTILQEVSLVTGFKEDFEFLCDQVGSIEGLLNEIAERRNYQSISNWIENLEDFVEDAMDIVEECRVASNPLFRYCKKFGNPIFRYRMGSKIKKLKDRITKIHGDAKYLQYLTFTSILDVNARVLNNSEDQRERSTSLIRESQTLGMEKEMKEIIELLLKEDGPRVVAVVGMGGQGKTLLAQRLFNGVRASFNHQVWLAVSQKFFVKQLLLDVGKQIKLDQLDHHSSEEVISVRIQEHLKEKSCLLVVDDVWDTHFFEKIGLTAWPSKKTKIVITTRDIKVAEVMPNGYIYKMKPLTKEWSSKLFCIHAFPDLEEQTPPSELATPDLRKQIPPPELASIADRIVEKCSGLPLAVKTVGGYMATVKRIPNDWQRVLDRLNEAVPMSDKVMPSLRLSYEALPNHLKACFVYCSVFPKNTDINSDDLVYAWIAQEFVSTQVPAEEAYDLGRSYIDQFIDRCLMEVSVVGWDGRVESCKMHDLLHDLALSESLKQTKCLLEPGGHFQELSVEKCRGSRRISLMKNDISSIEDIQCPGLRTLLLSDNSNLKSISASVFNNLRYLTVLDLSRTSIKSFTISAGNLIHLKFLNLSRTKITRLPKSLSGLRRLQFLDISYCYELYRLHSGIGNHQFMLHLNMNYCFKIELFPVGISHLTSLQTLEGVVVSLHTLKGVVVGGRKISSGHGNALKFTDLKGLRLLQHLSLTIAKVDDALSSSSNGIQLEEGIFGGMTKMRSLDLRNDDETRFLHLPKDMEVMQGLEIVRLSRCVVPKWIFELQNLMELDLVVAPSCSADDYRALARIPHLRKIVLTDNDECIEFPKEFGEPMAFRKLEWLEVNRFKCLEKFPSLPDNAMPMLKHLEFYYCNHLKNMPEGLERLQSLQEVEVWIQLDDPREADDLRNAHCWQILKDLQIKIDLRIEVRR